jgi:hypothetical protein
MREVVPGAGSSTVSPKMTEEQAERLRSQVPDDPIALPVGHLACEVCGVAVPVDVFAEVIDPRKSRREPYTRCPECRALHQRAVKLADEHPFLNSRLGLPVVVDRIEWTLWGLAVIGQTMGGANVPVMLTRLYQLGQMVAFRIRTERARRECSPYPWAHVGLTERASLRAAYGAALRDRLALRAEPVVIACPSTACLMCGIATITRPAIEVSRRGSVGATQLGTWRAVLVDRTALGGGPSPKRIQGHLCPACTEAIDEVGGVGRRARGRAVAVYLSRSSRDKADRLRSLMEGDFPPLLPAWGASTPPRAANQAPWAHLQGLLNGL